MFTRRAAAAGGLALIVAAGCVVKSPLESSTSTLLVHAVLNVADDDQIVVVQRTSNGIPLAAAVDSATVLITGPDGVVMRGVEKPDALGRSYHVTLSAYGEQLVPGATYVLQVHLKTGEDVTGTTTVPNALPAQAPANNPTFDRATDTLRLAWTAVPGAVRYEVRVQSKSGVYAQFIDTTAVVLPGVLRALEGKAAFATGLDHVVIVSAVDAAYYQYYRLNRDPYSGAAVQGNLTGAEGVFGSSVVVALKTVHVVDSAP